SLGLLLAALVTATAAVVGAPAGAAAAPSHSEKIIFNGGDDSVNGIKYHSSRIPSLIRTAKDTLIACVEGWASGNDDVGNINLLFRRSTDNGKTWQGIGEVKGEGQGVWGNATAVVDRSNNRIWLFMNHQPEGSGTVDSWDDRQ